jgi:hypothetical protein
LKKQTHQSNSKQSDFTLGILPRFEREPENSRSQKNWIAGTSESRHQSQTIGPLPLQRGFPCSLIQCTENLIKLSADFRPDPGPPKSALNRGEISAQFDEIPHALDERAGETALERERPGRLRLMSRFACTRNPIFV